LNDCAPPGEFNRWPLLLNEMKLALLLIVFTLPQLVADNFHGFDFKEFSYPYRFWNGRSLHVPLKNGEHEYDIKTDRGWFRLSHVYITDVTGDKRSESIVMLSHVSCGASCDGGSALFYVYGFQNHKLKLLWKYETGSLAYGCGLKSFAAKGTTLTVEQFGRCSRRNRNLNETSLTGKFQVTGVTRLTFKSNGTRFVARKREFFSSPERSVINYEPQIDIAR
jgi:hypothetical protein